MSDQKSIMDLSPQEMVNAMMQTAAMAEVIATSDGTVSSGEPESENKTLSDRELILHLLRANAMALGFFAWTVAQQQRRVVPAAVTNGARNLKVVL